MTGRSTYKKLLVASSLILVTLSLLIVTGLAIGKRALQKHQITYSSLVYSFPSTLRVENLHAEPSETFQFAYDAIEVRWSWLALLKKKIKIKYLYALDGSLKLVQEEVHEKRKKGLPKLELMDIDLVGFSFYYCTERDTVQTSWEKLRLNSAIVLDSIFVDSLHLDRAYLGLFSGTKDTASSVSAALSLDGFPDVEVNYLGMVGAELLTANPTSQQHIQELDLVFTGWKSQKLLDFQVDRLGFVYQDTLEVDLVLDNGILNSSFQTELRDLDLRIPGLSLHIPLSSIQLENETRVELLLDRSYFTLGTIRNFLPSLNNTLNPALPDDTRIYLEGDMEMTGKSLHLHGLRISTLDSTTMTVHGIVDWSEQTALNLSLSSFRSSRSNLNGLLAKKEYNDFYYWPTGIIGNLEIQGEMEDLKITGTLDTDQGKLEALSKFQVSEQGRQFFMLDLKSDSILVDSITGILPITVPYGDVHFNLALQSNPSSTDDTLQIEIRSKRLVALDEDLNRIYYTFYSDAQMDRMYASVQDEVIRTEVNLITEATDEAHTFFHGRLEHLDPKHFIPGWRDGSFSAGFSGGYHIKEGSFQADLDVKALQFTDPTYSRVFPDTRIEANGQPDQIALIMEAGNETILHAKMGMTFPATKFPNPAWFMQWPSMLVGMKLHLDENVVSALTGIEGGLMLDTLWLVKNTDHWETHLKVTDLSYGSFEVKDVELNSMSNADSLGGTLRVVDITEGERYLGSADLRIRGRDTHLVFDVRNSFPETIAGNFLSIVLEEIEAGFMLKLHDDAPPVLNNNPWHVTNNEGLAFNRGKGLVSGDMAISRGTSRLEAVTDGAEVRLMVDSVNLGPLYSLYSHSDNFQASISGNACLNNRAKTASWEADLLASLDGLPGSIKVDVSGRKEGPEMDARLAFNHEGAKAEAVLKKENEILRYTARLHQFNLDLLHQVPAWPGEVELSGAIGGSASGILGGEFKAEGYLVTENLGVMHHMNSTPYKIFQDTVFIKDYLFTLHDFDIQDDEGGELSVNGSLTAFPELRVDLMLHSDSIAFIHTDESSTPLGGQLKGFADLQVTGGPDKFRISGLVNTLPESRIRYKSPHSFELVDASQIVTFRKLDTLIDQKKVQVPGNLDPVLEWDLEFTLKETEIQIMLDEIHQEYLQLQSDGHLSLKTGFGISPLVYGSISSNSGRAFVKPPAVPELNLYVDEALLSWNGLLDEPLISFKGYDLIKASTRGLSGAQDASYELLDYKIYAILDQVSLSEFDLQFDLEAEDSEVQVLLASLPPETREAYALNLLVFGRIGSEKIKGNTMLADQVTQKLNELARRNFKHAGLSFSSSNTLVGSDESNKRARTDFSYSLYRGFMNNKLNFSVGGSVGVYMDDFTVLPPSHLIGDLELSYRLSEKPYLSLTGTRENVYQGIIDGMVTQESVGLTFKKTYHRFNDVFGTTKGEEAE